MAIKYLDLVPKRINPEKMIISTKSLVRDKDGNGIDMANWIQTQIASGTIDTSVSSDIREAGGGVQIGRLAALNVTGANNVALGPEAGEALTTGINNIFIGNKVAQNATATVNGNVAIGYLAGGLGDWIGSTGNILIGTQAGQVISGGDANICIGTSSGFKLTTGSYNVFVGERAGGDVSTSKQNVAIGYAAGRHLDATPFGNNVAIGHRAMRYDSTGAGCVVIGENAASNGVSGSDNVVIGAGAAYGYEDTYGLDGASNVIIGARAAAQRIIGAGNIIVGHNAVGSSYNEDVLGDNNIFIGKDAGLNVDGDHDSNIVIGWAAGQSITTGDDNIFIGKNAGNNATTSNTSIVIGDNAGAGAVLSGDDNILIGGYAGYYLTSGFRNICIGNAAGYELSTTNHNTFMGWGTARNNTGTENTALGMFALFSGGAISNNTAVGAYSGYYNTGDHNVFIGNSIIKDNGANSGDYNVIIGSYAGYNMNGTAANNVIIGRQSGHTLTGDGNILIGYQAGRYLTGTSNVLYIENSDSSTPLIYGEFDNNIVQVNGDLQVANVAEGGTANIATKTVRELHTLAAAATSVTTIDIPAGALLLGASINVNTAVTTSSAGNTWESAFSGGSTTALAPAATSGALNTKHDIFVVPEIAASTTNITFDAVGAETFTAGVIEVVAYYQELTSLANV